MAEKIYKIQKELSDKKQKRLEEAAEEAQSKSSDPSLQWQTSMSGKFSVIIYVLYFSLCKQKNFAGSLKDLDSTIPPNRVAPIECSNSNSSSTKINTIKQEVKIRTEIYYRLSRPFFALAKSNQTNILFLDKSRILFSI